MSRPRPLLTTLAVVLAACCLMVLTPPPALAGDIEPVPSYQPPTRCAPKAKPGTTRVGHWLVTRYGGGFGGISRSCSGRHATSEHNEGRAFDWTNSARRGVDRTRVRAFIERLRASDAQGNELALGRRMGVMYVIWNDRMYAAWNGYRPEPYLSSSCRSRQRCSVTLRHRDHAHVSLTRKAARAQTSWFTRSAHR